MGMGGNVRDWEQRRSFPHTSTQDLSFSFL